MGFSVWVVMEYKASNDAIRESLVQSGLSSGQSALYEALKQHGPLTATRLAFLANVPRTLSYKLLGELESLGLVSKQEVSGKVARFVPAHPLKLKELADKRFEDAKDAKNALNTALAKLVSDFNTIAGAPGVRILEGVAGVAELYEDELNERQPIRLIRSPKDDDVPELHPLVKKQLAEQVKLGISVRVIAPLNPKTEYRRDAERLIERRIVPTERFNIPSQVAIYANKVAITSYEEPLMTTIIENTPIRKTFEIMFEYMWASAEAEDQKIRATFT